MQGYNPPSNLPITNTWNDFSWDFDNRNLIRYSSGTLMDISKWGKSSFGTGDVFDIYTDTCNWYRFIHASASITNPYATLSSVVNVDTNKTFTISFKYKTNNNCVTLRAYALCERNNSGTFYDETHYGSFTNSTTENTFTYTFTVSDTVTRTVFRIDNIGTVSSDAIVYLKDIKFEQGSIATDWNPAAEDIHNDGILNNFAYTTNSGWIQDENGYGLNFDGIDDNVNASHNDNFNMTQQTMECWINLSRLQAYQGIIELISSDHNSVLGRIMDYGSGNIGYSIWLPGAGTAYTANATGLTANNIVHIIGTYDGTNLKIYINGVLSGTTSTTLDLTSFNSSQVSVCIGNDSINNNIRYMKGIIYAIRIYDRVLSQSEITANYNNGTLYDSYVKDNSLVLDLNANKYTPIWTVQSEQDEQINTIPNVPLELDGYNPPTNVPQTTTWHDFSIDYVNPNLAYVTDFVSLNVGSTNYQARGTYSASIDCTNQCNNFNSLKLFSTSAGISGTNDFVIWTTQFNPLVGDNYTVSFYAKSLSGSNTFNIRVGGNGSSTTISDTNNITTTWIKYVYTINITGGTTPNHQLGIVLWLTNADTIWISQLKVEESAIATPWNPGQCEIPTYDTFFHFDDDLNSNKGLVPNSGYIATLRPLEGKFGGAVAVENGTTNLISASLLTSIIGYNSTDLGKSGTLQSSGYFRVPKMNTTLTNTEVLSNSPITIVAGQTYTISFYFMTDGNMTFNIDFFVSTHNPISTTIINLGDNLYKAYATYTTTTGQTSTRFDIYNITWGTSTYIDINYVQLEQSVFPTSYVNGTRNPGSLLYPSSLLNPSSGSINCWVYVDSNGPHKAASNWCMAYAITDNTGETNEIRLAKTSNFATWGFKIAGPTGDSWLPTFSVSNGWNMFTITWGSSNINVYLNGVNVNTSTNLSYIPTSFANSRNNSFYVGQWAQGGDYLNSMIDELYISQNQLTDSDILSIYNSQQPFYDANISTNPITLNNFAYNTSSGWKQDINGYGLTFDGIDDYGCCPDNPTLQLQNGFTLEAWIYPNVTNYCSIICKDVTGSTLGNPPYSLEMTNNVISVKVTNTSNTCYASTGVNVGNALSHVIVTYNNSNLLFYINGILTSTQSATGVGIVGITPGNLNIGQQKAGMGRFYNGTIYQARIYNRVLSQSEITTNYNNKTTGDAYIKDSSLVLDLNANKNTKIIYADEVSVSQGVSQNMPIATGQITIVDYNDALSLTGYITSNITKTQMFNPDNSSYNPDWTASPYLVLTPSLFVLGTSSDITTTSAVTDVNWYKVVGGTQTAINADSTHVFSGTKSQVLTIKTNEMAGLPGVDYMCQYTYHDASTGLDLQCNVPISFSRVVNAGGLVDAVAWLPNGNVFKNNSINTLTAECDLWRSSIIDSTNVNYRWFIQDSAIFSPTTLTAAAASAATTITVASSSGMTVGQSIIVGTANPVNITAINTTTITLSAGLSAAQSSGATVTAANYSIDAGAGWRLIPSDVANNITGVTGNTITVYNSYVLNIATFKCVIKDTDSASPSYNKCYVDTVTFIDQTDPVQITIASTGGTTFKNGAGTSNLTAKVYQAGAEVDAGGTLYTYTWTVFDQNGAPSTFNGGASTKTGKTITVGDLDVNVKATFNVSIS